MTEHQNPHGVAHMRCSDEDREAVAQVLNTAYSDGRLDFDEHTERLSKAYGAKTFGELDDLTLDLVPGTPAAARNRHTVVGRGTTRPPVPAGVSFMGGRAILSNFRPGGPLVMPAFSEVTAVLGDVRIDLVNATFLSPETTIRAISILGDIRIRVPEGVRVVSNVSNILGDFKAEGIVADEAQVTLVVEGTCLLGDVKVLGPNTRQRKYDRFV